ncbi:uncharacterized protein BXZ73DRAFT_95341 [Epithele typhae]|uniref:uncharacterized protein n=1 Tax=Epithele typhae TaxID=378194 RepID=UPI002008E82F|nr:uncharacterized protein BXZ73DRAFT_95341 [Epithele typhae]KAH9945820.1 hypothetical protein BXZ73DRAFT_95341 [Epithele typhae]
MSPVDNSSSLPVPIIAVRPGLPSPARPTGALPSPDPAQALRRAMHHVSFVPRPFPPPALADVPLEYIVNQLHRLASHYWSRPETSDCTIVVSLDNEPANKMHAPPSVCDAFQHMGIRSDDPLVDDASANAARAAPKSVRPRRMIMKLHMDYLCAHSALFRGLLSGASTFDLAPDASMLRPGSPTSAPSPALSRQSSVSSLKVPCILPSSTPTHPVVHLPIPDPASFHHLVHYIYFGSTAFIEDGLDKGDLAWEGIARNVEFLRMGSEIKQFLGRYWRRSHTYSDYSETDSDGEAEYNSDLDESSDDDMDYGMSDEDESTLADPDEEGMCLADDEDDDFGVLKAKAKARAAAQREPPRGRQRAQRRLGHSSSDPVISHRVAGAGPSAPRRTSRH